MLVAIHESVLTWVTNHYIHRATFDRSRITHVYMDSGDRLLESALSFVESDATVLLTRQPPSRRVQCGAVLASEEIVPKLLASKGADPKKILCVPGHTIDRWHAIQLIGQWMDDHPQAVVCILCDAIASASLRHQVDTGFTSSASKRTIVFALPSQRYTSGRWWRSTSGCKDFFWQTVSKLFDSAHDKTSELEPYMNPDEYEQAFKLYLQELGVKLDQSAQKAPSFESLPANTTSYDEIQPEGASL